MIRTVMAVAVLAVMAGQAQAGGAVDDSIILAAGAEYARLCHLFRGPKARGAGVLQPLNGLRGDPLINQARRAVLN